MLSSDPRKSGPSVKTLLLSGAAVLLLLGFGFNVWNTSDLAARQAQATALSNLEASLEM